MFEEWTTKRSVPGADRHRIRGNRRENSGLETDLDATSRSLAAGRVAQKGTPKRLSIKE